MDPDDLGRKLYHRADLVARDHPLNRGRVSWWYCVPPYAGGARWLDLVGMNHGSLAGGAAWRTSARPGGRGALSLATNANVMTTDAGPALPLTQRVWCADAGGAGAFSALIGRTTGTFGALLRSSVVTDLTYMWHGTPDEYGATTGLTIPVGRWFYAAVTITTTAATVYLGDPEATVRLKSWTNTKSHTSVAGGTVEIGSERTSNYWQGLVDDCSIWTRALAPDEIRADFELGRAGYAIP